MNHLRALLFILEPSEALENGEIGIEKVVKLVRCCQISLEIRCEL